MHIKLQDGDWVDNQIVIEIKSLIEISRIKSVGLS